MSQSLFSNLLIDKLLGNTDFTDHKEIRDESTNDMLNDDWRIPEEFVHDKQIVLQRDENKSK